MDIANIIGAVYQLSNRLYGGLLVSEESTLTVGVTATEVAPADPERVVLLLVNLGTTGVYVAPTSQVSSSRGIYLSPNGGAIIVSATEDGHLSALQWWARSTAAGQSLYRVSARRFTSRHTGG